MTSPDDRPSQGGRSSPSDEVGRVATAGVRMMVAAVCGAAAGGVVVLVGPWQAAVLSGWDVAAVVFVAWVWLVVRDRDSTATAHLARREDSSRAAADLVLVAAAVVSLVGVGFTLLKARSQPGGEEALLTVLSVASVVLSWLTVQAVYTLHYARAYYEPPNGGIDFNEDIEPDFRDFAYVALTLGMTYQVSDTNLTTRRMRRLALRQALLSYLFGTVIVALMINVVAGLLNR